jgi:transposase
MVVERGCTLKAAAVAFNVNVRTAAKWARRWKEPGPAGLKGLVQLGVGRSHPTGE